MYVDVQMSSTRTCRREEKLKSADMCIWGCVLCSGWEGWDSEEV
jgi:hypothetical protein